MYRVTYDIDFSPLLDFLQALEYQLSTKAGETNTAQAIKNAGDYLAQEWILTASTKFKHTSGAYAKGILDGKQYPFQGDPLRYDIVHPDKSAYWLENGYESFDMKKALETSPKVRVNKQGKRYLVIPFNHNMPGQGKNSMPKDVYKEAKNMQGSFITGTYQEGIRQIYEPKSRNGRAVMVGRKLTFDEAEILAANNPEKVKRYAYSYGDKLISDNPRYNNMYRFENNVNIARNEFNPTMGKFINKTKNQMQNSTYLTFRVMKEDSEGWWHPGLDPMNILKETVDRAQENAVNIIAEGVKQDIEQFFSNLLKK